MTKLIWMPFLMQLIFLHRDTEQPLLTKYSTTKSICPMQIKPTQNSMCGTHRPPPLASFCPSTTTLYHLFICSRNMKVRTVCGPSLKKSCEKSHFNWWNLTSYTGWHNSLMKTCCWHSSDSSGSWWAATVAAYCPGRITEHSKLKSTGGFFWADGSPCISLK